MATIIDNSGLDRLGGPVLGRQKYWRQVLRDDEIIHTGDVVFSHAAFQQIYHGEGLMKLLRLAEESPNMNPPEPGRPYTTIYAWGGQFTLSQMLEKSSFAGGFVMRPFDDADGTDTQDQPVQTKRKSIVSLLPKNAYFSKPLPLP